MAHKDLSNDPLELVQIEWALRRRLAEQENRTHALRGELVGVLDKLGTFPKDRVEEARLTLAEKLKKSGTIE